MEYLILLRSSRIHQTVLQGSDIHIPSSVGRILFLCQCLYESQCPEACIDLLEKLTSILISVRESRSLPLLCCGLCDHSVHGEENMAEP
ncbi:hypothetical protein F7725_008884 [Dissostichus mawsoni]|uniref:Uncharacterized protein n=1 Tax=Dissostichus mawsoni TaxID=36200 RepID=A0A7J5Z5H5_DISMA|nr:hypothetical protein F7725_008884 [Dissostichus mawsoni]